MGAERTVLLSGGSRGLGRTFVTALLGAGYRVATFSRSRTPFVDECERDHGERFFWEAVSASDAEQLRRHVKNVLTRFGRIDALVNNAAIAREAVLPLLPEDALNEMLSVNLAGVVSLTQAVSKAMLRQRGGAIVNISSIVGLRGFSGLSVYSATKAALDGFTRGLARELGAKNIRVNSIAPGYLETDMSETLTAEHKKQIIRRTPLGRLGRSEDVSELLLYLISEKSSFVTGQVFVVDGGVTC